MLLTILNIIAPVFLVIGAGYLAVRKGLMLDAMIDGLNRFVVLFAIPCLLFRASSSMDLGSAYDGRLLLAFFGGATLSFAIAIPLIRKLSGRRPGEAVAISFGALFSNLVLLGLPISERAWGADSLGTNYAIISLHSPYCYLLGITTIELMRANGRSMLATVRVVAVSMFRNSLMIGLGLGFAVNLSGLTLPHAVSSAVEIISTAALPAALFGLGGVLTRYRIGSALGEAMSIASLSLLVHPLITFGLCYLLAAPETTTRSVVLMAAMPPGVNAYLFATMYNRGQQTAATAVLVSTALSILTLSAWLWVLH